MADEDVVPECGIKGGKRNKISQHIMQIISNGFDKEGNLRDCALLEKEFGVRLNCPVTLNQSLPAFRAWYKHVASLDREGQSDGIDTSHVVTSVPIKKNIQVVAYQTMVQAMLFGDVTSFAVEDLSMVGEIPLPLYFASVLLISASCRRNPKDGLLSCALTGASSLGKSLLLSPLLASAKVICFESNGVGRFKLGPTHLCIHYSDIKFSQLCKAGDLHTFKHVTRGEAAESKQVGHTEQMGYRFVVVSSNEVMVGGHRTADGRKIMHTELSRRGKAAATLTNDHNHETAVRKRLVEAHLLGRAKYENLDILSVPQDETSARLGLYAAIIIELGKIKCPLKAASPYFWTYLFAVLRHYAGQFSHFAQNTSVSEEEYTDLLLKRINEIEATCVPREHEERSLLSLEEQANELNARLISSVSQPDQPRKKRRRSKSLDVWPIFAPKRSARPLSPSTPRSPSPRSSPSTPRSPSPAGSQARSPSPAGSRARSPSPQGRLLSPPSSPSRSWRSSSRSSLSSSSSETSSVATLDDVGLTEELSWHMEDLSLDPDQQQDTHLSMPNFE